MRKIFTATAFLFIAFSMLSNDSTALHYKINLAKNKTEKSPVIILLHGLGSNEDDLFSLTNQLPDHYTIISARAPMVLSENSFAWYQVDFSTGKPIFNFEEEEKSRWKIIRFIEEMKKKYALDSSEIYLLGFSQGAIMSYSVALTRPDLVKGIVAISGRLLEEIKPKIESDTKIQNLEILILHGINDHVLSIPYARKANDFLKSKVRHTTLKEFTAGHEINNDMLKSLIQWLK